MNMINRSLVVIILLFLFSIEKGQCQYSGQDYFNFSYSASEQHNNDSAMYYLSRAIALDTTMSNAYYNRGVLRLTNQDLLGAIDDFSKCLSMDIAHGQAYNNRGYIYIMIGMKEKGCKDLRVGRDLGIEQSKGNFQMYCSDYKEY
jgi:tetratricopeptide (TPR) repeat protein